MTEPVFYADPMRLLIASVAGILLLLFLIIKLKLHPVISMMIFRCTDRNWCRHAVTYDRGDGRKGRRKDIAGNCTFDRIGIHVWRNS